MKLFILIAFSIVPIPASSLVDPKAVNLQLETSFQFNKHETNLPLIDQVKQFMDVLKNTIARPEFRSTDTDTRLTDFLVNLSRIVITYKDDDLKTVAQALNNQFESYNNNLEVYHEIFPDENLKQFVRSVVSEWAESELKDLRRKLVGFIEGDYNAAIREFIRNINKYFDDKDDRKLNNTLRRFEKLPKGVNAASKLVKNAIDIVVFNRYLKLNESAKEDLRTEFNKLSDTLQKLQADTETSFYKRSYPIVSRRINKLKKLYGSEEDLHKITKNSEEDAKVKEEVENEIVIDKNVEIFIQGPNGTS